MAMGRGDGQASRSRRSTSARWPTTPTRAVVRAAKTAERRRASFSKFARSEIGYYRAAAARIRGGRARRGASRRLRRVRSSFRAITFRSTRRSTQPPIAENGARRAPRAHHRKRSRPASTTSTSTPRRWWISTSRRSTSSRKSTSTLAADFTAFIRQHEPKGVTISVGGEIGEVGGKNSDVHELHAYMKGYHAALKTARRGSGRASARSACRPARRTAASSTPTARCGPT